MFKYQSNNEPMRQVLLSRTLVFFIQLLERVKNVRLKEIFLLLMAGLFWKKEQI